MRIVASALLIVLSTIGVFLTLSALAAQPVHATEPRWLGPKLKDTPKRIVSLAPSTTELLFAMGAGDRVVAVTRFCDYPPQVTSLPRVGGVTDLNVETVVAQKPDLVVGIAAKAADDIYARLGALGLTVLVVTSDNLPDYAPAVTAIADAVGNVARGREVIDQFEAQMKQVKAMASGQRQRSAMIIVSDHPIVAAGAGSFLDGAVKLLGLKNVVLQGPFPEISVEQIASRNPEIVIDMADMRSTIVSLGGHARVVTVRDQRLLRLSPRLPAALIELGPQVWL